MITWWGSAIKKVNDSGALRHNYWLLHDSVLSVLIIGNVYCAPINSKCLLNVHKYYISKYFDDGSSADTLWFNPKNQIESKLF